jgi:hypothetical protein
MLPRRAMAPQVLHCPKCRAIQPCQPRRGVCGARLPGYGGAGAAISCREIARLARLLVAGPGGSVPIGALVVWLIFRFL